MQLNDPIARADGRPFPALQPAELVVESLRCIARPDIRFVALEDEAPSLAYSLCHRPDLPVELQRTVLGAVRAAVNGPGREVRSMPS
ncbi:hypothetical protein [Variovorax sp. CF079]|uniref:hypothetical protein n=1 Tax=Variovorax sp. CF079 TaxID=1882774 RepID=UPI000B8576A2|nr:hypothetical protein [Variovorax sp. CF079]